MNLKTLPKKCSWFFPYIIIANIGMILINVQVHPARRRDRWWERRTRVTWSKGSQNDRRLVCSRWFPQDARSISSEKSLSNPIIWWAQASATLTIAISINLSTCLRYVRKFSQHCQNLENISHFFTFWDGFFIDFQNFWCSVKRRCPLLIRILYLFTNSVVNGGE